MPNGLEKLPKWCKMATSGHPAIKDQSRVALSYLIPDAF